MGTRRGDAFHKEVLAKLEDLIELMREVGFRYQVEPAEIAIAWAIAKGTVLIIGVTKPSHIASAVATIDIKLTKKEIDELERAAKSTDVEIRGAWENNMI